MNHSHPSSISRNEAVRSLRIVIEPAFSLLSLMLLLFMLGTANAQDNPMDSPPIGGADKGRYKSGKTPTGQRYAGRTPRFPYIEATNSRINFQIGNEKKPLSFFNSDLSVWL